MKINIAVLFGGNSVEHEVSIISALQAIKSMDREKYDIHPVYVTKGSEFYYGADLEEISAYKDIPALLKNCRQVTFYTKDKRTYLASVANGLFDKKIEIPVDVAFPIVHGTNVEDGTIEGYLNMLHIPYVGCDVMSSALCMDKYYSKIVLKNAGIPVLDGLRFAYNDSTDTHEICRTIESSFSYPVIVKPVNLGSSIGITKVSDLNELENAINNAFSYAEKIIVEPAVVNLKEVNCSVLGDTDGAEASECESPVTTADGFLSYEDKYMDSGSGSKTGGSKGMASLKRKIPADISDELREKIRQTSVEAFKELGCSGVVRIDFLIDEKTQEFWLNEINSIPGSLAFYLWKPLGIDYPELLDKMISLALKRARMNEDITYSFDTNLLSSFSERGGAKGAKG